MNPMADASTDDIAYVRQLAESAANAPLVGGRFMAWWGFLVTVAWIAQHLALNRVIGDGETIFGIIWLTFGVTGGLGQYLLARSMPHMAGTGTAGNRAMRAAWFAAAAAILSMVIGVLLASTRADPALFDWIVPLAFAVYASAQIVTGVLSANRVVTMAGYGAVAMVGISAALVLYPDRYLFAAAGAALTVMLPGLLLVRAESGSRSEAS